MSKIIHSNINELKAEHKVKHEGYEYYKKELISRETAENCMVGIYQLPPLKSAYPYHYHHKNEEVFYIISGNGVLKTPEGQKTVAAGDLVFFPANADGAHKLSNSSDTEFLTYIDFDVIHDIDVTIYPDSNKLAVWGKGTNKVYKLDSDVDYYEGE